MRPLKLTPAIALLLLLAPPVSAGSPQERSLQQLRGAQTLIAGKREDEALEELRKIIATTDFPQIHRDEAAAIAAELTRMKEGRPARDPEASRVRISTAPKPGRTFYVLPGGASEGDGSRERPFFSVAGALQAAATAAKITGGTEILLAPGRHAITAGLRLDSTLTGTADAPLVIRSAQPGKAVLYGGTPLRGFTRVVDPAILKRLPEEARGKVLQCDLKALGITDYGKLAVRGFGQADSPPTLELYAEGKAQTLARWPNKGFVKAGKLMDPGDPNQNRPSVLTYTDDRHERWTGAQDAWLSGYFHFLWAGSTLPVGKIDPVAKTLTTAEPYRLWGMGMNEHQGIIYHAFNLLEEIDQPGEWYLDRTTGVLYWHFNGRPGSPRLEISLLSETILAAEGVDHLRLEGLVFDCARFNGLEFKNCNDLLVAGCTIRRMAGSGVVIDGGLRNRLVGCDLHTLGRLGCLVKGGDRATLAPGNHVVANCRFRNFSRIDRTYTPAVQLEGVGHRVAHCHFENSPSSAMRVEGNEHVIEFNEFHRVVLESDDQGAIDMWNNPTYRGVVFRHNLLSEIGDPERPNAGQGGIRLDDVICGVLIHGNVFHRAGRGFGGVQMNCGRDNIIDNNLFIDCNIAVNGGYGDWNGSWKSAQSPTPPPEFIMSDLYRSRYPDLNRLFEAPFVNHMWRNAIIRCGKEINWSPEAYDRVANAILPDDPGFLKDGHLDRDTRAERFIDLGLRPIPLRQIGLYPDRTRDAWQTAD